MNKMTVRDIDVTDKRVLVRVDFNVPLDQKTGAITDDSRIMAALPTIRYLIERGARVILISHLGRPKGKVVETMRLTPVARRLSQILGKPVNVARDGIGEKVGQSVAKLGRGDVLLLENIRFYQEEEKGDDTFAQKLARLGDIFVNDAFGTSHRAHASVSVIANYLPAVAGLLLEKEITTLGGILESPAHPLCALLGGAKVSDKVGMIQNIMSKVDFLLIGGGMAATFLKAMSYEIGLSLIEGDKLETAANLIAEANQRGIELSLPTDVVIVDEISSGVASETASVKAIPEDKRIVDIGPQTIETFSHQLRGARTIFWNGPMGIYEIPPFDAGTRAIAELIASLGVTTIIGGGSTGEAINEMGLTDKMTFISTGGGASLKFLSGEELPGVTALRDK